MLIALPNVDGSFTVTLFLSLKGATESFAALDSRTAVDAFFAASFCRRRAADAGLAREFLEHPVGRMGTVYGRPWSPERHGRAAR
jgi:kynurenine 3-monooxygenase